MSVVMAILLVTCGDIAKTEVQLREQAVNPEESAEESAEETAGETAEETAESTGGKPCEGDADCAVCESCEMDRCEKKSGVCQGKHICENGVPKQTCAANQECCATPQGTMQCVDDCEYCDGHKFYTLGGAAVTECCKSYGQTCEDVPGHRGCVGTCPTPTACDAGAQGTAVACEEAESQPL